MFWIILPTLVVFVSVPGWLALYEDYREGSAENTGTAIRWALGALGAGLVVGGVELARAYVAIAFADPDDKQRLLEDAIYEAMPVVGTGVVIAFVLASAAFLARGMAHGGSASQDQE